MLGIWIQPPGGTTINPLHTIIVVLRVVNAVGTDSVDAKFLQVRQVAFAVGAVDQGVRKRRRCAVGVVRTGDDRAWKET
jgi:hypothetical protein